MQNVKARELIADYQDEITEAVCLSGMKPYDPEFEQIVRHQRALSALEKSTLTPAFVRAKAKFHRNAALGWIQHFQEKRGW